MVRTLLPSVSLLALALAGCQESQWSASSTRHLSPIPPATLALLSEKGMAKGDPILVRAYKKEAEMEVWKRGGDGRYALLKTFPICRWSGQLGPKVKQGDRQAPEGFYTITPGQMNPNSSYYLSFDTGFPNAYDRANNRTGNYLMVHGTCSSAGCFAMTDESIAEIYALARESFGAGQRAFQFQSLPFRMTAENLAKFRHDPNMPFWRNLKEGSDYFEVNREEPRVAVCGKRYGFGGAEATACGTAPEPAVARKREADEHAVAELVAKGTPAVRLVYEDGGQHASFREALMRAGGGEVAGGYTIARLGQVSRPDALAAGPREVPVDAGGRAIAVAEAPQAAPAAARPVALAFAPETARETAQDTAAPSQGTLPSPGTLVAAPRRGSPKPGDGVTVVARRSSPPERLAAKPAEKPAPITVADAGDDPSVYRRMMGKLFGDTAETKAPAPEARPVEAAPPAPPRRSAAKPAGAPPAGAPPAAGAQPLAAVAAPHAAARPAAVPKPPGGAPAPAPAPAAAPGPQAALAH